MSKTRTLAKMIDHTLLHPTATDEDLKKECDVAKKYNVASLCVKPYMVPLTAEQLAGSDVVVSCVVGFPAGNSTIEIKAAEADYVKTSTGFGYVKGEDGKYSYTGATIPNLKLLKRSIGPNVKVKASGGIRSLDALLRVQEVGCERCGATATVAILEEARERFGD